MRESPAFVCDINTDTFICGDVKSNRYYEVNLRRADPDLEPEKVDSYRILTGVDYKIAQEVELPQATGKDYQIYGNYFEGDFCIHDIYIKELRTGAYRGSFGDDIVKTEEGKRLVNEFDRLLDEILASKGASKES